MEEGEMKAFGLCVLIVSLQVYFLCFLLFIMDQRIVALINLGELLVTRNWRSSYYKKRKLAQGKSSKWVFGEKPKYLKEFDLFFSKACSCFHDVV
jgi:hypothetical protein